MSRQLSFLHPLISLLRNTQTTLVAILHQFTQYHKIWWCFLITRITSHSILHFYKPFNPEIPQHLQTIHLPYKPCPCIRSILLYIPYCQEKPKQSKVMQFSRVTKKAVEMGAEWEFWLSSSWVHQKASHQRWWNATGVMIMPQVDWHF